MSTLQIESCLTTDAPPLLDADTIHIWIHRLGAAKRGVALRAETRDMLGRLLCRYSGLATPPAIELGAHGKPFAPALPTLDFNISHSGDHVVIALAREQAIGIDIEVIDRRVSVDEVAQRFFSPGEAQALSNLPHPYRLRAFIALWTHKEAVLKAIGEGLGFGLERVVFDIDTSGVIGDLRKVGEDTCAAAAWQVQALELEDTVCAAIAWRGGPRRLRVFGAQ